MINKVTLIGNLGQDPELKYTQSQIPVCSLSIATKESWTKDGQKQENTEWHRVNFWNKQAEIASKYLSKGSQVYIEGKLKTRVYEKNGEKRYATEIQGSELKFLSTPKSDNNSFPKKQESKQAESSVYDDIPF